MASSISTQNLELDSRGSVRTPNQAEDISDDVADHLNSNETPEAALLSDEAVPDGGYGWIVIAACGVLTFWFVGNSYSWGILQASLVRSDLASIATLSFVGSITAAFIAILALVNARIARAIGARKTGMLGVGLLSLGEVLSGFTTHNIGGLFVTAGVISGLGTSLCFMVVSITPAQYFSKRRGLANGIVYAAGGFGGAANSFAMDGLIQRLGTAWTFRILGFMTICTGLPAAWLIQDRSQMQSLAFVDLSLLHNTKFILLFLAGAIGTFPLSVPPFFLPLYSSSIGLSSSLGAGLVAGFNFSSAIGRLICGIFCDTIGPVNTLFISLILSAGSMLVLWPVSTSFGPLVAFVIINGAANGGFFSCMPTVVASIFGSARVSVAMGMIVTGWVGGYLLGAPIAGFMLDAYGGANAGLDAYHPAIFYAGSMALAAAVLVAFVRLQQGKRILQRI